MNLSRQKRKHFAASLAVLLTVVGCGLAIALTAFAAGISDAHQVGVPFTGNRGVERSTADIMFEQAIHNADSPGLPLMGNEHEFSKDGVRPNPAAPRVASIPPMPVDQMVYTPTQKGVPFHAFSPQTLGPNFTAATLSGTNPTSSFPPDCDGAVGPTQYFVGVNGRLVTFNKTTGVADGALNATTNTFFTSVRNASGTSDPMVRFDRLSNRWFVTIINVSTPNRWLLAVSDAASNGVISGSTIWTYFFFIPATTSPTISNGSTCLSDYPSLGIDANALYTGVSEFCGSGQPFQQTDVFVIRKSSVLSGGPIVVTAFRALMTAAGGYVGPYSARGVDNYDPTSNEGYFVSADGASWGGMIINRVGTPGATPTLSANITVTTPAADGPRPVPHPGNTGGYWGRLDPLDDRFFSAHIRNQQLWTAHNLGVDNTGVSQGTYAADARTGSRWYHVNVPVNSGTPTVVEAGTVFTASASNDSLQKNYFIPSIMVSGQGHVAMSLTTAGESDNANVSTVGRLVTDPPGTMETPLAITTNTNTYNPTSDPGGISAGRPRRWGDYSITSVDPLDDMSMWSVNMFCDVNNSYGVRVTKLIAPPPAAPSVLADVIAGQSNTLTLTGVSTLGSGFFDPGANLPSPARPFTHLTATVTNGAATGTPPTVVSATFLTPTTVSLVLNANSATPNIGAEKYTITITNPDGQTAAAAIVHVVAGSFNITASANAGGSISPSGVVNVLAGANQTFTIAPDSCHTLTDVLVDAVSVGAITSYTFTNVQAVHTISAVFTIKTYTIAASAGAGGSITPSGSIVLNCGVNQAFNIVADPCFSIADVLVDGGSVGAVSSYTFTNLQTNHTIAASFVAGLNVAASGVSAAQLKLGNDTDGTTKITITYSLPAAAASSEVWRKGYGSYPTYDDGGGSVPTVPGSYPPSASGWTLTGITASGQTDEPATRDDWYYVVYGKDACSNVSPPSALTSGTLDYHLGDVSDGITPGQGDNTVSTPDVSLMGAYYGMAGAGLAGVEYLDVGPTTDLTTNGRPTTDQVIDFEDLVLYAVNYTPHVSLVAKGGPVAASAKVAAAQGIDALSLEAPASVKAGEVFEVPVALSGSGRLQALSISLRWDASLVEPMNVAAGDLVSSEGGVVFSPGPGRADAALLGAGLGLTGQGVVATVRFRALAAGTPNVSIARAIGRSSSNKDVAVTLKNPETVASLVTSTELFPVIPNPMRHSAMVQYSLVKRGPVNLAVYSVDGRHVKTLANGVHEAGRFSVSWDGADEHGSPMKSGMYFVRYEAAGQRVSRVLSVIR